MAIFKTERDKAMLVVIALSALLAYAYYEYVYTPQKEELTLISARVEALHRNNDAAKRELARGNVEELRAEARSLQENLELMRQLVPLGNEVPALLEQVSNAARRAGLDIGDVQPQPVIAGDEFDTYRYKLDVIGSYHELGEFLSNVGSLTRIVAPQQVALSELSNRTIQARAGRNRTLLAASLFIQTYVAKASPGAARSTAVGAGI